MKIIKKEKECIFTEQDLTDMYAESVLNEEAERYHYNDGFIVYFGKTFKENGSRVDINTTSVKDFKEALDLHAFNKGCCDDINISKYCYYHAFIGKIIAPETVVLIDAYAVEY